MYSMYIVTLFDHILQHVTCFSYLAAELSFLFIAIGIGIPVPSKVPSPSNTVNVTPLSCPRGTAKNVSVYCNVTTKELDTLHVILPEGRGHVVDCLS